VSVLNDDRLPKALRSRSPREAILEDIGPYVGLSPEERGRIVDQLSQLALDLLRSNPHRDEVIQWQDPVPESTRAHWRRLMKRAR
jgi:hypothetical protein